jgi:hypothetical protein
VILRHGLEGCWDRNAVRSVPVIARQLGLSRTKWSKAQEEERRACACAREVVITHRCGDGGLKDHPEMSIDSPSANGLGRVSSTLASVLGDATVWFMRLCGADTLCSTFTDGTDRLARRWRCAPRAGLWPQGPHRFRDAPSPI